MRHFLAASTFRKEQDTHGQPFLLAPWGEGERPNDESTRPSRRVVGTGLRAVAAAARLEASVAVVSRFEFRWGRNKLPFEEDVGVDERRLGSLLGPSRSSIASTATSGGSGGAGGAGGASAATGEVVLGLFGDSLSGVPTAAVCLETL